MSTKILSFVPAPFVTQCSSCGTATDVYNVVQADQTKGFESLNQVCEFCIDTFALAVYRYKNKYPDDEIIVAERTPLFIELALANLNIGSILDD